MVERTAKVRVLCSIDETGNWGACGWKHAEWGDVIHGSAGVLEGALQQHFWITAEVPIPDDDPREIAAQQVIEEHLNDQ